jgi:hypothetical protein
MLFGARTTDRRSTSCSLDVRHRYVAFPIHTDKVIIEQDPTFGIYQVCMSPEYQFSRLLMRKVLLALKIEGLSTCTIPLSARHMLHTNMGSTGASPTTLWRAKRFARIFRVSHRAENEDECLHILHCSCRFGLG